MSQLAMASADRRPHLALLLLLLSRHVFASHLFPEQTRSPLHEKKLC